MASCTLYKNSGFNSVNIPDSSSLLQTNTTQVNTSTVDVLQNRFLTWVSVKVTWEDVRDVDYCQVGDFFYYVSGITMTSYDVARLTLVPDFITSAGGPTSLTILDGVTDRHHVAKADDTYGTYDEADPLLSPAQPLNMYVDDGSFLGDPNGYFTIIESTIDLVLLGYADGVETLEARTFKSPVSDSSSEQGEVTVPYVPPVTKTTTFGMGSTSQTTNTIGSCCFDATNEYVQKGVALARALGVEDAIVAQYALPSKYFAITYASDSIYGNAYISKIDDVNYTDAPSDDNFNYVYTSVRNMRLLYGDNNKYGILSVSGDSTEFNPEQIYTDSSSPSVRYRADPRNNGKPYFNFTSVFGQSTAPAEGSGAFFKNAVGGMEWRNVPLRFVEPSNSILDTYNLESSRRSAVSTQNLASERYELGQASNVINTAGSIANSVISGISGSARSVFDPVGGTQQMASAAVSGIVAGANGVITALGNSADYANTVNQYNIKREQELTNFGFSQSVVVPTVKFPFQTPSIRDYVGNGCFMYRYHPTASDLSRMDKLLTAYGYKHTTVLDSTMFTNRPSFNYVKASGVSVGGTLPTWWKSGIADQFANGVRIWHVSPSPSYYTANE